MKLKIVVAAVLVVALAALAGPIKVWSAGEYITAADLNATLTHLHSSVGHGHGPVVVNSDISASAAISHSKLATPSLLPKAWAALDDSVDCTAGSCTISEAVNISSVTRGGAAGQYTVTFTSPRPNAAYAVLISGASDAVGNTRCQVSGATAAASFDVICYVASTGAGQDGYFSFMILDLDN